MTTNNVLAFTRPGPSRPPRSASKRVRRYRPYFGAEHPLAEVARHRCRELGHRSDPDHRVGPVACGPCWEAAIRADERFAVENDLDDADPVPADDLDEIALEKAMRGERVPLTEHERATAIARLHEAGLTAHQIAKRLHMAHRDVEAVLSPTSAEAERLSAALAA
jgi:hypothetical protein